MSISIRWASLLDLKRHRGNRRDLISHFVTASPPCGEATKDVPSPSQMEKVDCAKRKTDVVPLAVRLSFPWHQIIRVLPTLDVAQTIQPVLHMRILVEIERQFIAVKQISAQ
jgi:hypothetical protein